jgi:hypothetical protein
VVADSFTQVDDELLFTERWADFVFCNYLMPREVNDNEEWLDDNALFDGDEDMEDIDDDNDV